MGVTWACVMGVTWVCMAVAIVLRHVIPDAFFSRQ